MPLSILRVTEYAPCAQRGWTVDGHWSNVASRFQRSPGGKKQHGRARARETKTDTGNPAFLGWHAGRRTAPAALRRLLAHLFPAAAILPVLRLAQGLRVQGERQGQ